MPVINQVVKKFHLNPIDNDRLILLCGFNHENIKKIEITFDVIINNRSNHFKVSGQVEENVEIAISLIIKLYELTESGHLDSDQIEMLLNCPQSIDATVHSKLPIKVLNAQQQSFIDDIQTHDISFGVGPSGTGKTYLAVASAVHALRNNHIKKIILVRPALEAGEKIGYLPGDMAEKINPYLQPLYDALYELMGVDKVNKAIETKTIEINILAFMRGRTFKNSFVIIDEAQNCTSPQMKMALTRIGYGSKMVIVGDHTQSDLVNQSSGLDIAISVLKKIPEISVSYFDSQAVVRHKIVQKIVQAYEKKD